MVDAYNSRDKLVFTSEVVADFVNDLSDQLINIMKDLKEDQTPFRRWVLLLKRRRSMTSS